MPRIRHLRSYVFLLVLLPVACGNSSGPGGAGGSGGSLGGMSGGGQGGAGGISNPLAGAGGDAGVAGAGGGSVAGMSGVGGTTGTGGTGGATLPPAYCELGTTQCNDGVDNDGDNLADSLDPECVSPCDNDEGSFATGISGDNIDACKQDCFFDGNSGMGDDGCEWNLKCDSNNPGGDSCPYDPNYSNCPTEQSQKCVKNCQKLAPNGCDCFGCCAVDVGGQSANVLLTGSCTADKFGDPTACPRCTQTQDCLNPCDACEVCFGRPAPAASCMGGSGTPDAGSTPGPDGSTPAPMCPAGSMSCGPGGQVAADGCEAGYFCQTGCCVRFVID